ncbi:hypothetical protein AB0P36_31635 [Streptomyces flavidovirens]|uniref:hypothetical protein n=1 Tax=Streptomyces flavidovirens TaxID=67298 RepID=UPI00344586A7
MGAQVLRAAPVPHGHRPDQDQEPDQDEETDRTGQRAELGREVTLPQPRPYIAG